MSVEETRWTVIAIKVAIVFVMLCGIAGAWCGFTEPWPVGGNRVVEVLFSGLFGLIAGALICAVFFALAVVIGFLVSG